MRRLVAVYPHRLPYESREVAAAALRPRMASVVRDSVALRAPAPTQRVGQCRAWPRERELKRWVTAREETGRQGMALGADCHRKARTPDMRQDRRWSVTVPLDTEASKGSQPYFERVYVCAPCTPCSSQLPASEHVFSLSSTLSHPRQTCQPSATSAVLAASPNSPRATPVSAFQAPADAPGRCG